jgi:PhnB protein
LLTQLAPYIVVITQRKGEFRKLALFYQIKKTMTQIISYLNFNGKTREAMQFYQQCFGGELVMQKIAESPMAAQMPSEMGNHILHSSLTNSGIAIMASDMLGDKIVTGNSISLCLNCSSQEEINLFFENLSKDGKITHPLHQSFWGSTFGHLVDKYGINWMLNYSKN